MKPSAAVLEKLQKYRETKLKSNSGYFRLESGKPKTVRVLPPKEADEFFFKEMATHRVKGKSHVCPKITNDDPCPFCELQEELYASKNKEDRALAKKIRPRRKWIINLIDRGDTKPAVREYRAPKAIIDILTRDYLDEDYDDVLDPMTGRDYKLECSGEKLETRYDASTRPKPSALLPDATEKEVKEFLDSAPVLGESLEIPTYDELQKILSEVGEGDFDDNEDEPSKESSKKEDKKEVVKEEEERKVSEETKSSGSVQSIKDKIKARLGGKK